MEKRKVNKGIIFISIIFVITLLGGITGYVVNYKSDNKDVNKGNSDKDNKVSTTYELKKYSDDLVLPVDGNGFEEYTIGKYKDYIMVDVRINSESEEIFPAALYIFKDNKLVRTRKSITKIDTDYAFGLGASYNYYCTEEHRCIFDRDLEPNLPKDEYDYINEIGNYYLVRKNDKFCLFDVKGKIILDCKYDYIDYDTDNKYLLAVIDNKIGVIDLNGNVVIDLEYEAIPSDYLHVYSDIGKSYYNYINKNGRYQKYGPSIYIAKIDDNYIFNLKKDNTNYILNENNEVLVQGKNEYVFYYNDNKIQKFISENEILKSIEYYNLDGKLIKTIDFTKYNVRGLFKFGGSYYASSANGFEVYDINDTQVMFVDKNLNTKIIDDVYYDYSYVDDGKYKNYYMNDKMYVKKENNKYNFYSFDGKLITQDIVQIENYIRYSSAIEHYGGIIICKEENTKCAVLSLSGKLLSDFEFGLLKSGYLFNNKNRVLLKLTGDVFSKCTFDKFPDDGLSKLRDNIYWSFSKNILFDDECAVFADKDYYTFGMPEGGYLVAKYSKGYDIYDKDNNKINYINKDNVKLEKYIGEVGNKLFFIGNNTLYYIEL